MSDLHAGDEAGTDAAIGAASNAAAYDLAAALSITDDRLPLHARIREVVVGALRVGHWPPGTALPAESALAAQFGASVGTVRRVMSGLVDDGLLERRQGAGTYVRRASFDGSLFRFFRHGSADGAVPVGRILERRTRSARTIAPFASMPQVERLLWLHRLRSHGGRPLLHEEIWLPLPAFDAVAELAPDDFGDLLYPLYEERCGLAVAHAEETLTIARADARDAELLGCAEGDPVAVIERLAFAPDGTPIERRVSRGAGADFSYRVHLR